MFDKAAFLSKKELNGLINSTAIAWQLSKSLPKNRTCLIITATDYQAKNLASDLNFFLNNRKACYYPVLDKLVYENIDPDRAIAAERCSFKTKGIDSDAIIVSSIHAAAENSLDADLLKNQTIQIKVSQDLQAKELAKQLSLIGYKKNKFTEKPAEFSWHGQTLDIFPANFNDTKSQPVRIEFDQEKIISIKTFLPENQRTTTSNLPATVKLYPARELITNYSIDEVKELTDQLKLSNQKKNQLFREINDEGLNTDFGEDLSLVLSSNFFNLLNEAKKIDSEIYLVNPDEIEDSFLQQLKLTEERYHRLRYQQFCLPPDNCYLSPNYFKETNQQYYTINQSDESDTSQTTENNNELKQLSSYQYSVKKNPLIEYLSIFSKQGYKFFIVANSENRIKKINQLTSGISNHKIQVISGKISEGFKSPEQKIIYIAESEIFPTISNRNSKPIINFSLKHLLSSLSTLEINDIVVHEDYGLGKYLGLKKLELSEAVNGEFICLEYADSTLYLPVQKIGRIQKYSGLSETEVTLDRLGSKRWEKVKNKVKKSINDLAGELLKLYALRKKQVAKKYSDFNQLDQEFADSFPYNETEDQQQAIDDTLKDLSSGRMMDRLICGDVGFGKTEIALRASFKVAMEGDQVAILAPTTLLVEQHFENFKERFAAYPLQIGVISRFYSSKKNQQTLEDLKSGKINIIIGTHALIKNTNIFNNLGLLVIDEEQRFGVKQKEKIKQMQVNTHVLTLSATPIPRTLYMSLINIKDISVITSPPINRLPVKTSIHENNPEVIRDAVLKEISRGGQIYYLHNRVQDIELEVAEIREIVPEAKIAYAHGQMPEQELDRIMTNFKQGNFNLLVTTTIIENGIDLPNANTMIVDRADCFGLAQLYQLRGRVGRSSRQAYTHLLVPSLKKISSDAQERLNALKSINQLGGGFQLAVRDLEIRGAGNILGREQSGNIAEIGYDLYTQLLNQAIENLQGNISNTSLEPDIKLPVNAYIPSDYLIDPSERVILYQRFASLTTQQEVFNLLTEVNDRYGKTPPELNNYASLMQVKLLLKQHNINGLEYKNSNLYFKINQQNNLNINKIIDLVNQKTGKYKLNQESLVVINPELNFADLDEIQRFVFTMLTDLSL